MKVDLSALLNLACAMLFVAVTAMFGLFLFGAPPRGGGDRAPDAVTIVTVRKPDAATARPSRSTAAPKPGLADAFAARPVALPSAATVEVEPIEPPDLPPDARAIRGNEDRMGPPYGPNGGIGGVPDASVFGPAPSTVGP